MGNIPSQRGDLEEEAYSFVCLGRSTEYGDDHIVFIYNPGVFQGEGGSGSE